MLRDYDVRQEIGRDPWTVWLRAERRHDRLPVLVKATTADAPSAADADAYEREFAHLRRLEIPGVARPVELLRDGPRRALVLADSRMVPLAALRPGRGEDTRLALEIGANLLTIVAALHRRDVIHGGLSASSVHADADGAVQVVDLSAAGSTAMPPAPLALTRRAAAALPYASPEQTGRMNRGIDHRTDLYSAGVILFELLTGTPPFVSDDPLELVHWHIARTPPAPAGIDPLVDEALSAVIAKLMAKTPEERYQSADGAKADLEACLAALVGDAPLVGFVPGRTDGSDRFLVSERLYGRDRELRELVAVLDGVRAGGSGLVLIGGASGVGKTVLIQELYKPLVRERGSFTSGKFDLAARDVPFGGVIQAFSGLLRQLLAGAEDEFSATRERVGAALGPGASVLAGVIPEVQLLVGPQPPAPPLDGVEALNRFQMAFVNFLGALARPGRPLVVFLDDLQRADAATLNLLGPLLTSTAVSHLLIVGAYRDTEVDANSPLMVTLNGLVAAGVRSWRITLAPLPVHDVEALLSDTLRRSPGDVAALARLVHATTAGSPFFVSQFLKTLHRDHLLQFDASTGSWQFDIDAVADAATTEDVAELMTSRIQRLDPRTQRTLTFAGLLGGRFRASTVAAASEAALPDTESDLREAMAEGLVVMAGDTFRFLHDRVQQAAMGLLPPGDRAVTHAAIGRRLLARWDRSAAPEQVFEVVGHLNRGVEFHGETEERLAIARLNLEAGQRAKASTAWESAAGYFDHGIGVLEREIWRLDANLGFALHLEAADCHYLARHFDTAESYAEEALAHAPSPMDAAQVHALRMVVHENLSHYDQAVASGRLGLALLGVQVPEDDAVAAALDAEIQAIESLRAGRTIASLVELPAMSDPSTQTAMRILTSLWSPAYISGHQFVARWISATLVRLSLSLGNTGDSAYGYVTHAITIGPERGDYESAYEWGRLALAVNGRFDDRKRRAKIYQQFHAHVCLWRRPFAECVSYAREATRSGLESGDLNYAGYGAVTETWAAFPIANDLAQFVRDYEPAVGLVERLHLDDFRSALRVMLGWALALQGRTASLTSLTNSHFDEASYLRKFGGEVFFRTFYYTAKLHLCVMAGDVAGAQEALRELERGTLAGTMWPVLADFWGGLALAAGFAATPPGEQARQWARMSKARDSLRVLAENAPDNYRVFWLLLSAEMARVSLQPEEAARLAADASAYAAEIGNVQQRALANEIGARALAAHAGTHSAQPLLADALRCYEAWGARAKVAHLRAAHPDLLASMPADGVRGAAATVPGEAGADPELSLDVATVLKISQAIAVEIRLADLLPKLMRIAIESAGAQRGVFIQESKGRLVIEAEWSVGMDAVRALEAIPIDDGARVATSVIRYVRNTSMSVVVSDALRDDRFAGDPYVQAMRPRSILSVPVVHQGRVSGILYLEHRLAQNVFTNERVSLMHLVSAQAAIALENAGLYRTVTDEAAQRRRAEEMLREVTEGTATALGEGFFRSLVQHLASALRVRYAFVTECREARSRARSLAFWSGDSIVDNFEYDVADTPCKGVFDGGVCYYPRDVQNAFPKDLELVSLKAESYLGAPMVDAAGQVIGHIAVLDELPMADDNWAASVLSIFSARAGAELERLHAERELRAALVEVETLKNRLQDENVYLQDEIRGEHNFEDMVGSSPALLDVLRKVERVAATDATVLILGETGTGKELVARALHSRSSRKHRPLVKVNCGAITAGLVESELFGHVKGAFTGAIDKRVGRFELADGGTIFLDEVGELPLESQVKLLRVLQEQEFEPVGSSRTVRVNVRVIAATNRNLEEAIADGRFRADLYFRLNVLSLTLPPLRERHPDIPLLVTFYVARFARQFGKRIDAVSQDTMRLLSSYAWPGNIRELQNVVERAVVLTDGPVLSLGPDLLPRTGSRAEAAFLSADAAAARPSGLALQEIERRHIESVLRKANFVIEGPAGAAQVLNLHPNTLRSRMKKLGISRPTVRPAN